jgi:hypothetical protein
MKDIFLQMFNSIFILKFCMCALYLSAAAEELRMKSISIVLSHVSSLSILFLILHLGVSGIVGRAEILACTFFSLSFLSYHKYVLFYLLTMCAILPTSVAVALFLLCLFTISFSAFSSETMNKSIHLPIYRFHR